MTKRAIDLENHAKDVYMRSIFSAKGLEAGCEIVFPVVWEYLYRELSEACAIASAKLDGKTRVLPLACHSSQNSKKQLNS